jgi:hypothetical protein
LAKHSLAKENQWEGQIIKQKLAGSIASRFSFERVYHHHTSPRGKDTERKTGFF